MLEAIDPSGFDAATTQTWARGVEQLHRGSAGGRHRRWAGRRRPDPADRDWSEARARLGNVDTSKLCRTEAQRRADALLEMARAAVACPPDAKRPLPTVNFLLDEVTARAAADNDLIDPLSSRDVTSRTDRGARVDPDAIIGVSLWAMIRRVVTDSEGVVTDLGRTSRLCSGYAREAVMLLEPTCIRPGCDQPHSTDIC